MDQLMTRSTEDQVRVTCGVVVAVSGSTLGNAASVAAARCVAVVAPSRPRLGLHIRRTTTDPEAATGPGPAGVGARAEADEVAQADGAALIRSTAATFRTDPAAMAV